MSGMAGNITAFNTVWTYDIYQSYIAKNRSDKHYLWMGRIATASGILISIGTAYLVMNSESIMDYMQMIFTFFNAPLFATFLLGMFWKRTTPWAAFWGLVCGTLAALVHFLLTAGTVEAFQNSVPQSMVLHYSSAMAANFWRATIAWLVCFCVTIALSFVTKPKPVEELQGLVWGMAKDEKPAVLPWYKRPAILAVLIMCFTVVLNVVLW
jgi:SSS family solute:Na+ symporter